MGIDKQLSLNGWIMGLDYGNFLPTAIRWGTFPMPLVPLHRTVQSEKLRFPGFQMWGELDNWFLCVSLWLSMAIQSSSMIHTGIHTTAAKAGKSRHLGFTPHVRGSAKNACDHAHGGGEGRCNGADPLKLQGHGMALTATECSFHQSDQVSHWSQASEDQVWQVLTSGSDRKGYNVFSVLFEGAYPLSVYCRSMERRRLQNDWPKLPSAFQHGFRCALYQVYLRQEISNEVCCWHAYSTIYTLWQVAELICVCWYG